MRFLVPNVVFEPAQQFKAGAPEDYPDGSITFLEEERVFLLRRGNTFRCLSAVCTHLGCTVNRTEAGLPLPLPRERLQPRRRRGERAGARSR